MSDTPIIGRQAALLAELQREGPEHYLGVDPGREGAAVVLDERRARVVYAAVWSEVERDLRPRYRYQRVWVHRDATLYEERILPHRSSAIGAELADELGRAGVLQSCALACEALYVGANPASALDLAWGAGALLSPLEVAIQSPDPAITVSAMAWRPATLRIAGNTEREAAKQAALRGAPGLCPGLAAVLRRLGPECAHLAEAACIAYWARQEMGWR